MKKILILGNSYAGAKCAQEIRLADSESEIIIFCTDAALPFHSHLFVDFLSKKIEEKDVYFENENYYQQKRIQLIANKTISRINLKKNILATDDKEQISFDILVIADAPAIRFPEMKGTQKAGVFSLERWTDVKNMAAVLPVTETVAIDVDTPKGLTVACRLKERKKDVIVLTGKEYILSQLIEKEPAELITQALEKNDIRVARNNDINEILGNGDVKAIRLESGKVLAAQVVILGRIKPDWRLVADSGLAIKQGLMVNEFLRTNLDHVYAMGKACEFADSKQGEESPLADQEAQAKVLSANISGQPAAYQPSLRSYALKIGDLEIDILGQTKSHEGCKVLSQSDGDSQSYKSILIKNDRAIGVVLINTQEEKDKYLRLIEDRVDVSSLGGRLLNPCSYAEILEMIPDRPATEEHPADPQGMSSSLDQLPDGENIQIN
ncbi:MAG: FAD-dependent oxidoreductase [Candidatus Omnitrophota bacterium]